MTYDASERYVVRGTSLSGEDTNPSESGATGGGTDSSGCRGPEIVVPLAVQENAYWGWGKGDPLDEFMRFVELYWGDIETEGFARLRENYGRFGSTMYGWEAKKRLRNIIQELADARAYLSSGDV